MSWKTKPFYLFILAFIQILGIASFCKGFFPYKVYLSGYTTSHDAPSNAAEYDRLVFIVIDALRNDFILGDNSGFDFVNSQIQKGIAFPFTAKATAPTVTLPRIKALTTGTIPSFLDAILNIAESDTTSSLANHDNWVYQYKQQGNRSIYFFGDDTWIRLFPDLFTKTDGTTSFYVSDTVQVDLNVTRHIETDLRDGQWDAAILHYLGLDHIGHLGGPKSPLMKPKQKEMDEAIETIYRIVQEQDALKLQQDPAAKGTLMVVCGDHGMNEKGNHGGSSIGETSAALVFLSPKFKPHTPRSALVDLDRKYIFGHPIVDQIDLVPTLASLFSFPVPKNNLGKIIPELYQIDRDLSNVLEGLKSNAFQLGQLLSKMLPEVSLVPESTDSTSLLYLKAAQLHQRYLHAKEKNEKEGRQAIELYYKATHLSILGLCEMVFLRVATMWCHEGLSEKVLSLSEDIQWHSVALTLMASFAFCMKSAYSHTQKQSIDMRSVTDISAIPIIYRDLLDWELVKPLDQVQLGKLIYNYQGAAFFVLLGLFYVTQRASLMAIEESSENKSKATLELFLYSLHPLVVLLNGTQNAILLFIFTLQFQLLQTTLLTVPTWLISVIFTCLAHCGFFLTGHTNSLASVDLSHAYVGVQEYNPFVIGFLTFFSNWSGGIWWMVAGWVIMAEREDWFHHLVIQSTIFSLVLSCLSISVTVLREHLFIWTVFSPKYLYQISWTCLYHWLAQAVVGSILVQYVFKWNPGRSALEREDS
ncbi:alkaline-phosphatase-like protein [Choanephora cucurbitarum]|nr:alkaline-phosphatase-like protein [Choanephora cucurbitarum]